MEILRIHGRLQLCPLAEAFFEGFHAPRVQGAFSMADTSLLALLARQGHPAALWQGTEEVFGLYVPSPRLVPG